MTIKLDEKTIGLWHAGIKSEERKSKYIGDVMLTMCHDDHGIMVRGRLRWYRDSDFTPESNDVKIWKEQHFLHQEEAMEFVKDLFENFPDDGLVPEVIMMDETGAKGILDRLQATDWAHVTSISSEEYQEMKDEGRLGCDMESHPPRLH